MRLCTLLFVLLFSVISNQVLASKARLQSLSNSRHVLDEQQIFTNPLQLNYFNSFVTYESGMMGVSSTTTATSNAEVLAGFDRKDGTKLAFALGHQDSNINFSRKFINDVAALNFNMTHNPLHLFYATTYEDTSHALSLQSSHYRDRVSGMSESTVGATYAVELGAWQLVGQYILVNASETAANRFDGSGFLKGTIEYLTDTNNFYISYTSQPARAYNVVSVIESHHIQTLRIGLVESNLKDGHDPFWGAEILTTGIECKVKGGLNCQKVARSVVLPVWLGFESQALSWMVLRASVRQTVLFNQSKDDVGYPTPLFQNGTGAASDFVEGPDSVQIAMGMGLDFGGIVVDGNLQTATTTFFDLSNFLTQVSLKYKF